MSQVFWFFVPSEDVPHPETLQPVIKAGVAYSIAAFEQKCDETGIDTVNGAMLDLNAARNARADGRVSGFVILQREDTDDTQEE